MTTTTGATKAAATAGWRALVVDDHLHARTAVARLLQAAGHECDEAASAAEAMVLVEGGSSYDVMLLDIMMPGMSGIELASRIRSRDRSTAIVMVSGLEDGERAREAARAGADAYVVKPFSISQIILACEQAMEARRRGASSPSAQKDLLDVLSHDVRNPLAVARGYLSLAEADPRLAESSDIAAASGGCETAIEILQQVEELGRIERSEVAPALAAVDAGAVAREAAGAHRGFEGRVSVRATVLPGTPPARADRALLAHVVSDLAAAALKHASGRTEIAIDCRPTADGRLVEVSVTDDGPRVPEELREALFDRDRQGELKRAKARRGRGLALPFAWAATKLMGGSIRVEDAALKDGAGEDVPACRFVVSLPVAPPRERPAEAPSRLAAARAPGAFASGAR